MSPSDTPLVVGIGSPHGDDQAGWQVIETLSAAGDISAQLRKAAVPHDIIDWLDVCRELHIADACQSTETLQRMDLLQSGFDPKLSTRAGGSHQVDVGTVLKLAETLSIIPPSVTLWAIPARKFRPNDPVSDSCQRHIWRCAELIRQEVCGA